jgi:nucleotide-binding universal stress UspA family protein
MAGALIVGYDGSDYAKAALDVAIEIAAGLGDTLVIAYAEGPPDSIRGEEYREHRRALHEIGERVTGEALDRARAAGVEAEVALVPEKPVSALVDLAEARAARMIVVGSRGEGMLAGAFLGAVAYRLLHHSSFPVLVVPQRR